MTHNRFINYRYISCNVILVAGYRHTVDIFYLYRIDNMACPILF